MINRRAALFWGLLAVLSSILPFLFIQKSGSVDLSLPLLPVHGDLDLVLLWIKGLGRGEFIPFLTNGLPRLGAPFHGLNLSEGFPLTEQLQLLVLKAFTFFSSDPMTVWNLYFLSGYFLATLAFFLSALTLGIHPAISFGLSVAFNYLPFHFLRYEHLFLSQYWVMAPAAAILIHILRREMPLPRRTLWKVGGAIFLVTLWHAYYGYFFTGVLCLGWLIRFVRRNPRSLLYPILIVLLSFTAAIGVSVTHHLVARYSSTDCPAAFKRNPSDALMFSLRPRAIFLPVEGHRFTPFRALRDYTLRGHGRIEGLTESLGTLGLSGFLCGIWAFFAWWRKKIPMIPFQYESILVQLLAIIYTIRPGVSSWIAYGVNASFRDGNRISPMLGAAALFSLGIVVSNLRSKWIFQTSAIGIGLAVFSLWDQVLPVPEVENYRSEIQSTRKFVADIESRIGDGAVLQLPFALFPEQGAIFGMSDYAHTAGPLFSEKTRWSYGSWRGTRALAEIQKLSADPSHFSVLRNAGYSGIWIDRKGYPDGAESLIADLEKKNPAAIPLNSADGRRIFFSF